MNNDAITNVRQQLQNFEDRFRKTARRWKLSYRGFLLGSVISSTVAAVIGQLKYFGPDGAPDAAAILAGLSALLTTLIVLLDFESNWRLNRRFRHEVSALMLESYRTTADADVLLQKLQDIVQRRTEALIGQDA
jgi:hypothetical protein